MAMTNRCVRNAHFDSLLNKRNTPHTRAATPNINQRMTSPLLPNTSKNGRCNQLHRPVGTDRTGCKYATKEFIRNTRARPSKKSLFSFLVGFQRLGSEYVCFIENPQVGLEVG
jgi:hypothetical protein